MNILILGNGGREFSIGLAIYKENAHNLFFMPGNGATDRLGTNINIKDYNQLALWAKDNSIDLTIVGPEAPLVDGVVDIFKEHNLTIFGPSAAAARLEGSKVYMKNILKKYNIPTAAFIETSNEKEAHDFIETMNLPIVVKADGLCAGKGVIIAQSKDEAKTAVSDMLSGASFGDAGTSVVVEEYLDGYELSVFAICDGENYKVLPAAQDHKRIGDGDTGPNTGGMGAYAPTPLVNDDIYKKIEERVIIPTLAGMRQEGAPFEGDFASFGQCDERWGKLKYSSGNFCSSACGVVSTAMIITTLKKEEYTPDKIIDKVREYGGEIVGSGSSGANLAKMMKDEYKLTLENLNVSNKSGLKERIETALDKGGIILTSGKGGRPYSSGGHFVVIYKKMENGKWLIGDPAGKEGTSTMQGTIRESSFASDPKNILKEYEPSAITTYAHNEMVAVYAK